MDIEKVLRDTLRTLMRCKYLYAGQVEAALDMRLALLGTHAPLLSVEQKQEAVARLETTLNIACK